MNTILIKYFNELNKIYCNVYINMNAIKSLVPRTQLAQYQPGQEINFELIHEGEALKANSCYLTGQ
jgi:hypothetical protein